MPYKSLPLAQELIGGYVAEFIDAHDLRLDDHREFESGNGCTIQRYTIGRASVPSALIDFICNGDGTTTIHYKTGKNQELGAILAEFVKGKINPNEFESIEMTLQDLRETDVEPLFEALRGDSYPEGGKMFNCSIEQDNATLIQIRISSLRHRDHLVLKFYRTTHKLQIQGKPLFTYKRLSFHLIDILDLWGIEKILNRRDDTKQELVSVPVAEHFLKEHYPHTFQKAPDPIKKLMLSGLCVSLASPEMVDYSMLLYPDLRALEGALHDCLSAFGLYSSNFTDAGDSRLGVMYKRKPDETFSLASQHVTIIQSKELVEALEEGYNHYSGKRHPLFHMNEQLIFSYCISDLGTALTLITDTKKCIEKLYQFRPHDSH